MVGNVSCATARRHAPRIRPFIFFAMLSISFGTLHAEVRPRIEGNPEIRNDVRYRVPSRRTASDTSESSNPDASSYWSPDQYRYYIGYEGSGVPSVLPQNSVVFGHWFDGTYGGEVLLGYANPADTYTATTQTTSNAVAGSLSTVTSNSGTKSAATLMIGISPKIRIVQSSWVQLYLAGVIGFIFGNSTDYDTGTRTVATPDITAPTTYTTTESALGNIKVEKSSTFLVGPKLGSEFYLKWIPNLALGFSTGFLFTSGGQTTTSTNTRTRTIATIAGVDQTASPDTSVSNVAVAQPGFQATTFGIGGAQFNLFGNFSLRYVW